MIINTKIVEVTAENIADHPGVICFINPKNEFYQIKIKWLLEQFKNGLKIKLMYVEGEKSPKGFVEYVPGEYCWRPVDAKGYMFIHCIWTNGKKYQRQGLGRLLISEAENDASGMNGVAVLTSDGSFMANSAVFLKNGYRLASASGKDQLLVKQFRDAPLPAFKNPEHNLKKYNGLTIIYSNQCPWVSRFIQEVKPILKKENLSPEIIEIKTPEEAQKTPSFYGIFDLIYNGRILADRYISMTRFVNIINKEVR
jgi:hypothetical protein